jgi:hypothetical protein
MVGAACASFSSGPQRVHSSRHRLARFSSITERLAQVPRPPFRQPYARATVAAAKKIGIAVHGHLVIDYV